MRVKVLTERPMGRKIIEYLQSIGEEIVDENPDILVVAYYPRILKKEEYENIPHGAINLHPGLLPWNRGMFPHIWPLIDNSPAGVTIHYIDNGIDTGDIIAQKKIKVEPIDTAGSLEKKTQKEMFKLFKKVWQMFLVGDLPRKPQKDGGSYHKASDLTYWQGKFHAPEGNYDNDPNFLPEFLDFFQLRASTFEDRSYAYFEYKGDNYYVGIKFYTEDDIRRFNERNK